MFDIFVILFKCTEKSRFLTIVISSALLCFLFYHKVFTNEISLEVVRDTQQHNIIYIWINVF